jgi:putative phosphoesterase
MSKEPKPTGSILVAILADTHGFLDPRVAEEVCRCDYAVHAGDVGCEAVLQALHPRRQIIVAVAGNNDVPSKWPEADLKALSRLPDERVLSLPGGDLVVVHGHRAGPVSARHLRLRQMYPEARAIVYGHSHRLTADRDTTPWVLNPGAAGRSRTFGGPSCVMLTASSVQWQIEVRRFKPLPSRRVVAQRAKGRR